MTPPFVIVMGVSGSGKTTLGRRIADQLGVEFFDADDYHSADNVRKMSRGQPLDDKDRAPWLEALAALVSERRAARAGGVLACSALKEEYREVLGTQDRGTLLVFLEGSHETISRRLERRQQHFMSPSLLQSQFDALEAPSQALTLDASLSTDAQLARVLSALNER